MSATSTTNHSVSATGISPPASPILVGIAGCTGVVGQRFIALLQNHPWFKIACLSASDRSSGRRYVDAVGWKLTTDLPDQVKEMLVTPTTVEEFQAAKCSLVFSALDANIAGEFEANLALAGIKVFSNARNHRYDSRVPILIPHANSEHINIIPAQQAALGYEKGGYIVTNANCSSTGLVVALRPLMDAFGIEKLFVTTMQAISGAGYPGVASLDITDNVVPFISGEEDKMELEPQKILGRIGQPATSQPPVANTVQISNLNPDINVDDLSAIFKGASEIQRVTLSTNPQTLGTAQIQFATSVAAERAVNILNQAEIDGRPVNVSLLDATPSSHQSPPVFIPADFKVSAQCNRVHVIDGHMECVSIKLKKSATVEEVEACLRNWQSEAQTLKLPSAPKQNRPQPRLDRDRESGYVVTVGRVRLCPILDFKFALCSHNTVLGAAGGSILNAELAYAKGFIQ